MDPSRDHPRAVPPPTEDLWFVAENGEQTGPFPESVLRERLRRGELSPDALVWSEGMQDWAPARRVRVLLEPPPAPTEPALPPEGPPPSAAVSGGAVTASPASAPVARSTAGENVHAWARFGARVADLALFHVVALAVLHALTGYAPDPMQPDPWTVLLTVGLLGAWTPIEAWFLARFGTTPGKWAFGIHVLGADGQRLGFARAWRRALMVWGLGLGLGLPVLQLVMAALAWRELSDTGTTPWDRAVGAEVTYRKPGTLQRLLVAGFLLLVFLTLLDLVGRMASGTGV